MKKLAIIVIVALAAGCGGDGGGVTGNNPPVSSISVAIVAGQAQSDTVGRTLATPLTVRVTDQEKRAVQGQVVNFVVIAGGGSVFAGAAATDADGRAADIWTLGPVVGEQRVEIRAVTPAGAAQLFGVFTAEAKPGPPASLSLDLEMPILLEVGANLAIGDYATVRDEYGNELPDDLVVSTTDSSVISISADTIAAVKETRSAQVIIAAVGVSGQRSRFVLAFLPLEKFSWEILPWRCENSPPSLDNLGGWPIVREVAPTVTGVAVHEWYQGHTPSGSYGRLVEFDAWEERFEVWLVDDAGVIREDTVIRQIDNRYGLYQLIPDTLELNANPGGFALRTPDPEYDVVYRGGTWCEPQDSLHQEFEIRGRAGAGGE